MKINSVRRQMAMISGERPEIDDDLYQLFRRIIGLEAAGCEPGEIKKLLKLEFAPHIMRAKNPQLWNEAELRVSHEFNTRLKRAAIDTIELLAITASEALLFLRDVMNGGTPLGEYRSFAPVLSADPKERQAAANSIQRYHAAVVKAKTAKEEKAKTNDLDKDFAEAATEEEKSNLQLIESAG